MMNSAGVGDGHLNDSALSLKAISPRQRFSARVEPLVRPVDIDEVKIE